MTDSTRMIRNVAFRVPDLDVISRPAAVPRPGEPVRGKTIGGGTWRRAHLDNSAVFSSLFINAHLEAAEFESVTLDSCLFTGCTLAKAIWSSMLIKDVIFHQCDFQGASLRDIRTVGPVAFIGCNFQRATFQSSKLGNAIFDRCRLTATTFTGGDLAGCDLRGNDLTRVIGVIGARGVVISEDQIFELSSALALELDLRIEPAPSPAVLDDLVAYSNDDGEGYAGYTPRHGA